MTNPSYSLVQPNVLSDNKITIHQFLRHSYEEVNRHMEDGVSFLKDMLFDMNRHASACFSVMLSPINNFLKDHRQIEADFVQEAIDGPEGILSPNIVPINIALLSPMEENY